MPFWSAGHAASSSGFAIGLGAQEIGLSGSVGPPQRSSPTGSYVMATAEHREPCESRGSCTVLGARGREIPPRDSTFPLILQSGDMSGSGAIVLQKSPSGWSTFQSAEQLK
jgi:hypothetical protein